jgi:3-oxoacyl-[acyl-carrier protein] reductase
MKKLENKIAVTTGSARGIGFAIASAFAREGAVSVIIDLAQETVDDAVAKITAEGNEAVGFAADVADGQSVEAVVSEIISRYGTIDILVNNAGITKDTLIMKMSEKDWDDVLRVNLKGTFIFTQKVCRYMFKKREGVIINISSVIGISGNAGQANYASSKGGVIAFTKSAAKEFASRNVRVNAVAPGFIQTEMTAKLPETVINNYLETIPLKRGGAASDVAKICIFLASDDASYITGQTINIDGGLIM